MRLGTGLAAGAAAALLIAAPAGAQGFDHVGTFEVPANLQPAEPVATETSAEIVAATPDGRTLIYTDSPAGRIGFVDVARPHAPRPDGTMRTAGEPTSVAILGRRALVAVNTSQSFSEPSGDLLVIDVPQRRVVRSIPLGGQPDSVAISPDGRLAAIVIENERDEDVDDGLIPQAPAGLLQVLDLGDWSLRSVDLTGLAGTAPEDPEPEYVDINDRNEAVVSLQENNHLAIVDLERARVKRDFPAGSATVTAVDATEEELGPQGNGLIELGDTLVRRREPDAVKWVDHDTFATANEGDYADADGEEGGSRSFTLFNANGRVEYESGAAFEHEIVRAGHFPQSRAANKGNEPEGLEVARFGRRTFLFVGSERANVVGVYEVGRAAPKFRHVLPAGIGPEGIEAIPGRDLLAVSAETDGIADGLAIRSVVTLYELTGDEPRYPQILSRDESRGRPIPWVALSGLAGDPRDRHTLWAVSDSYLARSFIYRVDVRFQPGVIMERIPVGNADDFFYDVEGIAARRDGGFWLASEGRTNAGSERENLLLRVSDRGRIRDAIPLPASLTAGATSSGFEGVAVTGRRRSEVVYAVVQREWADDEPGFVKLARFEVAKDRWTFARYPLGAVESPAGGWVGLSEITLLEDGRALIVERDDRIGAAARIKRLYTVDLRDVAWREHGRPLDTVRKRLYRDVLADLDAHSISVPDKLEGTGLTKDGRLFLATDNDGVDENFGETVFFRLGSRR